jgi:hypothetical protein
MRGRRRVKATMRQAPRAIGAREGGGLAHNTNDSQTDTNVRTCNAQSPHLIWCHEGGAASPSLHFLKGETGDPEQGSMGHDRTSEDQ